MNKVTAKRAQQLAIKRLVKAMGGVAKRVGCDVLSLDTILQAINIYTKLENPPAVSSRVEELRDLKTIKIKVG